LWKLTVSFWRKFFRKKKCTLSSKFNFFSIRRPFFGKKRRLKFFNVFRNRYRRLLKKFFRYFFNKRLK
jgi:hypothetical protein